MKRDIPQAERTYLAVPYNEREEAKGLGARWDGAKKAWYVGPEVERAKKRNGSSGINRNRPWILVRNLQQC